ncbi:hypothetical protein KUTeg_023013 [Tegillarca granosa]|uniref:Uncharacterized protein n=1 Tax=Tegillarca granosa TaxID=220873 RepID=A0ABQ9E0G6_TEGGR|nr:hypothetical protein KUTeg_023013 [Tegillarca granosa]
MTIRKHIFMRYCTKLQNNGTRLFMKKNVIDLETKEFVLTYENKRDILASHCNNNNIEICDEVWNEIISKECVVGFPYTCYLFSCHPKYTKQGAKFFEKPLEVLKENISELANSESKRIEKIQYCLMCYMVIKGGKIDLKIIDEEIFKQIIKSLQINSPSEREKLEAINELNHRYILGKKPLFSFKHQTILECVALCFKNNNISLLLQFCSKDFISEFVRPANYEDIEGEEIIKLNRNDYEHVIQRFVKFLLEEEIYRFPRGWNHSVHFYVQYPLLEDKEFIDLFINVIKSKKLDQNIEFTSRLFAVASQYGNHFINRVYNDLQVDTDSVDTGFCLVKAIFAGYTDTVVWLLDHNLGLDKVIEVLGIANTDTMTAIVNHHNITFNHVKKVIMERNIHCDKIVNVMINRWPDMDQKYVLELLDVCLRSDFEKAFGAIITSRQDFATHQVISQCLRGACFIGSIKVVEFIVSKQLCTLTQHIMKEIFTLACAAGQIEIFNYLLDLKITGIDLTPIYTTDNDKNITNLHVAACFGRYEVVGKLIKLGLDVNGKSDFGKSVMTYAIIGYKYRNTSEEFGKSHWYKQTRMEFPSLSPFIEKEDLYPGNLYDYNQVLNCLIPVISDINLADLDMVLDKQGGTLAHYCVKNNEKQTIELLKNRYIKAIFSKTSEKQTCLHIAAIFGRFDIFKMLVGVNKASLSIIDRDNSGRSVLQYAMIGFKFFGRETCCFEHDFDRNFDWMDRLYFQSVFDKISDDSESDRISDDSESDRISDDSESDSFIIDFKDKCNTVTIDNENDELGNAADKSNSENIYDTCIVREEDKSDYTMNESNNDSSDTIMKNDCDRGDIVMVENDNRSDNPYTSDNDRLDVLTVTNEHVMGEKLNTDKMWDIQTEHNVFQRCKGFPGFGNVSEYSEIFLNLIQNKDCDITDLDMVVNNCGCTLAHYCVVYDSRSVIKTLIDVRPSLFYLQNKNNHKPIDLAVLLGRDEIFEMLYPIQ